MILTFKFTLICRYRPTRLWGFSGHIQTILQSLIGRVKCPLPLGERIYITMSDASTLTYDLYQPIASNYDEDITVAICPGVGNSSESVYIRTFVHYAQCHGYRMAVLNHIGVISSINVTSPRIFTYGGK
jgi:abhydrolase domain-containing protein 2